MKRRFPSALLALVLPPCLALAADGPGSNPVRNPGFEDGATSWQLPKAFTVVDDAARGGTRCLQLTKTDAASYPLASQSIPFKPGMKYRYGAWIRTRGVQGEESGASICMEWSGPKGWLGGSYASGRKGDQNWFQVEATTAPIPSEATELRIKLYLRPRMTGTAWFDDVSVAESYPPALHTALLRPNYRGRLPEQSADPRILVRSWVAPYFQDGSKPEETTLTCSLRSRGKVLQQRQVTGRAGVALDLEFDGRALAPGDYAVRAELHARSGALLGNRDFRVEKLPSGTPAPRVFIDEHNRTIVEGKPFFPLGWYFGPGPTAPDYVAHLDRLAASPFNTVMCYGINVGGFDRVRAYVDQLASRNLKIIYSIKDIYAGTSGYYEPLLGLRGEETIVRGVVEAFKSHPAVLAWYLNDELPLSMQDRLEARQDLVRQLDPQHPTWSVLYQVEEFAGYLSSADVLGADPYPVPDRPVTMAGEWTRKCAAVSGGNRPLWMVPQAMDWASYHKDRPEKYRAPTLDEELVMTYLCLIHGAKGLVYYSYFDLMHDRLGFDRRWADMLVVGREVQQLVPALLSTAEPPALQVNAGSGVEFAVRRDDAGTAYVLMANPDPKAAATVRVPVHGKASLRLLQRGEVKTLAAPDGGQPCEISLPPLSAATLMTGAVR